jgi:uncharacterized membrane protein
MEISKLFGLPAHPLFVHIPVVLIPLVGIGVVGMALSARVRDRFGWLVLALAVVAGLSTQLAIGSGKALQHSVPPSAALHHHTAIAESIRPLMLLLFLAGLALMLAHRRRAGRAALGAIAGIAVVLAVVANVRLFQIGDSGARATWERVHLTDRKN